jgi:hypothetical protein
MSGVVIYAVGSPIVVDFEECLRRNRLDLAAAVRNHPGEVHLLDRATMVALRDVRAEIKELPFVVPLFTPAYRQKAAAEARDHGFANPFSLIDPYAVVPASLEHAPGLFVNAGSVLGAASRFEEFVFVNRGANIGHHCRLERFTSVGPGAMLGGTVTLGRGAVVGLGAMVLPGIRVGVNSVVGAGAVVTRDVPAHCLVFGNPARVVREGIAGYGDQEVT